MKYIKSKNAKVPKLGFGTWQIKGRECREAVENALNLGYRHIDTAQIYQNEEQVGSAIRDSDVDRDDIWLTTKIWRTNLDPETIVNSFHESLERLQTDYVDLLLIHWPNEEYSTKDALETMEGLKDKGYINHIGVSNFTVEQLRKAAEATDILTNQVEFHPYFYQEDLLEECRKNNVFLTAYSPLARGDVIGDSVLKSIGDKYGKSEAQIVLRWMMQKEDVCAIPKASTFEHQEANIDIFDFSLSQDEIEKIEGLDKGKRKLDPEFGPW